MGGELCNDNREILIAKYFELLKQGTNIETSYAEMQVVGNILFRMWQLGWLDRLEKTETECKEEEKMKYICIVVPLNDTQNNRYLFTYEFGRPPVKDMIVHCETRLKNGMYGKITKWARVPKTDEEQLLNIIHNLNPSVTLPLKPVDKIYAISYEKETEAE